MEGWMVGGGRGCREAPFAAPSDFDAAAPFERKLRRRRSTPNGGSLNQQVERPTEGGGGWRRLKGDLLPLPIHDGSELMLCQPDV